MTTAPVLAVFVPGALAGGLLVSLALLVGDALGRLRGERGAHRAVRVRAQAVVAEVRAGSGAATVVEPGRRAQRTYRLVAVAAWGLVALAVPGATWNFLDPGGYLSDISWMWAVSMLAAIAVATVAVTAVRLEPGSAPLVALVVGLGATLRFVVGPEAMAVGVVLAIGLPATLAAWVALRRWSDGRDAGTPAPTIPVLARTVLGR